MASLYKTTNNVRRVLFWVIVAVIVILVADSAVKFWQSSSNPFTQIPSFYEQPTSVISKDIPKNLIKPPSLEIAKDSNPSFTVEGAFPAAPDTARLYKISKPRERLDTLTQAQSTATRLGFTTSQETSVEDLKWINQGQTRTLNFNRIKQIWNLRTQYFLDTQALQPKTLLDSEAAYVSAAKSILNSLGLSDSTLQNGEVTTKFSRLGNDGLFTNPVNQSQANYVSATIYRKIPLARILPKGTRSAILENFKEPAEFDGLVYSTDPRFGSVKMILSDRATAPATDLYELDFTNYEINLQNYTVEFILTPQEAWSQVQNGNGSLMLIKPLGTDYFANSQKVNVTKFALNAPSVELAYWEPSNWEGYFYPIYVFRGRAELQDGKSAEFVFYMDALKRVESPVAN